ncbi:MAG TPA: hypothetical protein VG056_12185 [Pirellulales bacterium]|jgi:uncharacterized membrane protein YgcG|nr:hypothetical protein [Pirellulales bacterium]
MLKSASGIGLFLAAICFVSPARAGDAWHDFWDGVHVGWHRNNEWPEPFSTADKQTAVAPFCVMIANGWQRQNLIGENYFDGGSKNLNNAGIERIRSILRQAPVEHRVVYVERDLNDDVTNMRVDAVQQAVAALQPKGPMPEVIVSNMVPEGRPAEMVAAEYKGYTTSVPTPRLSGHSGGSSGGGGGPSTSGSTGSSGGSGGTN